MLFRKKNGSRTHCGGRFERSRVLSSFSSSLPCSPLWADATRQKYCDWSAIERDYYLRSTMERERGGGRGRGSLAKLGSSPSNRIEGELKNIIFSGSVEQRVPGTWCGQRDDKGGIWIFLRMIRFDVEGGRAGRYLKGGRVFDFEQPLLSRYYGSMRFTCFSSFPFLFVEIGNHLDTPRYFSASPYVDSSSFLPSFASEIFDCSNLSQIFDR